MGETIIKKQPEEVEDAQRLLLDHGIPIYLPVEHLNYAAADVPRIDHIKLIPYLVKKL